MLSWKRTLSIGLILMMLASAMIVFTGAEAGPTRASSPTLTNASVYPSTGKNNTLFNFTIWYTDADNDAPLYVIIVMDNVHYNMTETKPSNQSYSTGVEFHYVTYLTAGTHFYYFYTQNVIREGARDPLSGNYNISVQSSNPGPQLYNQTVNPPRPNTSTGVNFTVMYSHPNGTVPMYVNLLITSDNMSGHLTLNLTSYGSNYTAGEAFSRHINLGVGYYYYWFSAMVYPNTVVNLPASGLYSLYMAPSPHHSPPVLSGAGHDPVNPSTGQNTSFWVNYSDADGYAPLRVRLNYFPQSDHTNKTTVNLTVGIGNYTVGVNCSLMITAPVNGTYYYYFETRDLHSASVSTSNYVLQVGTPPPLTPYLTSGGYSPQSPTVNDTINFTVVYIDPRGSTLPDYVNLTIKPLAGITYQYNMTPTHTNTSKHILYFYTLKLSNGAYSYRFNMRIGPNVYLLPERGYYYLNVSGSPPLKNPYLTNGAHSPNRPTVNDTVNFTVTYTDPLGSRTPHYVQVYLTNLDVEVLVPTVYNMTKGGGDLLNGTTYYYPVSLMAGNYSYYFHAIVGNYSTSYPSVYSLSLVITNGSSPPPVDNKPIMSNGGHYPPKPTSRSNITFSVTYADRDGDAPSFIKLYINEIISSKPWKVYNMTWTGVSYVYGVRAQYILNLATGNYSYYFTASSTKWNVTLSQGGLGFNLTVVSGSTPPPPQKDRAPALSRPVISPYSPKANTTIYFSVIYTDADDDAPNSVKMFLSGNRGASYTNYSMKVPNGTYSKGVSCTYSTSLLTGYYTYYFTASSTNFTVRYPASGTLSFNVTSGSSPPPGNKSNIGARMTIINDDGQVTMDVTEKEEGFSISLGDSGEDFIEIEVSSQSGEDRVIEMLLDPDMFDIDSPDDIVVKVDGKEVSYTYVADPEEWLGDHPAYYIRYTEAGPVLYVLLPDADTHTITAKISDEPGSDDDRIWYYIVAFLVVIVIAAVVAISLLTAAQKKRIKEYYDDFDTGVRDERIASGKLVNEDDIDWEDLIEAE